MDHARQAAQQAVNRALEPGHDRRMADLRRLPAVRLYALAAQISSEAGAWRWQHQAAELAERLADEQV